MVIGLFLFMSISSLPAAAAEKENEHFVSLYGGLLTGDTLGEVVTFEADMEEEYRFLALTVGKRLASFGPHLDIEGEVQGVRHFGGKEQMEYNALFIARWLSLPWDDIVDTSFAVGEGLSYTTKVPIVEEESHSETSKLLNYLMFEMAFSMPHKQRWEAIVRIHHRSGIRDLFNGVHGASNAWGVGIRYRY